MKNLLCLLTLLLLSSCSTNEAFEKESNNFELDSKNANMEPMGSREGCTNPANPFFFVEYWEPSSITDSVDIHWDNSLLNDPLITFECEPMVGKIEIFADGVTNPNTNQPQVGYPHMECYGQISTPINALISVDLFNTTTYTLTIPDFGTKCLWWRIVLQGGRGCEDACTTPSPWHFVSTYDL